MVFLFLFWIVGAGGSTVSFFCFAHFVLNTFSFSQHLWGNLSFCQRYKACRILTALVAFAWLGWIVIVILIGVSLTFAIANTAWSDPMHGRYDPMATPQESPLTDTREVRRSVV